MYARIKNPLQRDGTNQQQRLAKTLLPENAKIDDRKIEEIIAFAHEEDDYDMIKDRENDIRFHDKTEYDQKVSRGNSRSHRRGGSGRECRRRPRRGSSWLPCWNRRPFRLHRTGVTRTSRGGRTRQ